MTTDIRSLLTKGSFTVMCMTWVAGIWTKTQGHSYGNPLLYTSVFLTVLWILSEEGIVPFGEEV